MAIKVNGTTVINDSRALQNIASVDSATVTALGNAGVGGGATSLIQGLTTTSNTTALTFNLNSGYDVYYLSLYNMKHSDGGTRELAARLGNSSGTLITTNYAYSTQYIDGTQQQHPNNSYFYFNPAWQPQSYNGELDVHLKIFNMEASNKRTHIEFYTTHRYDYGSGWFPVRETFGQANFIPSAAVNKNITFYAFGTTTLSNISYELWGVNL